MSDVLANTAEGVCELWLQRCLDAIAGCGSSEPVIDAYVAAGAIAWDNCCGTLVVAPEAIYRSAQFPINGTTDYVCETAVIVVDIVVLLLRCVPVIDDRGKAPTAAELGAAHAAIMLDAALIWNTVTGELPEGWQRANVNQTFVGASGGCIGVETRLSVGLAQDAWCPLCVEAHDE